MDSFRRYLPGDREALLAFRARVYGPASAHSRADEVRWLFEDGPGALWLHEGPGGIDGHIGAISTRLHVDAAVLELPWLVNLMVDPQGRRNGVGLQLGRSALSGGPALAAEVSEQAQRLTAKAGWTDLGELPLQVHPLRPAELLTARGVRGGALVGAALHPAWAALRTLRAAQARARGYALGPLSSDHGDALWARCGAAYPVIARRDGSWLAWRFERCPDRARYRLRLLSRRGEACGYAVWREGEHHGLPSAHLVDHLCRPEDLPALLSLVLAEAARTPAAALYCLHRSARSEPTFAALGFRRRSSGFRHLVKTFMLDEPLRSRIADSAAWFLTAADSDLERPREGTVYA